MTDRDSVDPAGGADSGRDLEALRRTVASLSERVAELERRGTGATRPRAQPDRGGVPAPAAETVVPKARDERVARAQKLDPSEGSEESCQAGAKEPGGARLGPLRAIDRESLPVVLLGVSGGIALLLGALYFAWYSIQQGWISPEVRLSISGALGVAGLVAAWILAPRGQRTVAASLGGAGLGAWFASLLVARHVYGFLGPGQTFALLALGALSGLLIASHRRLRFLASLAALGAFATPLSVPSGVDRLQELMGYQCVVVFLLFVLEDRRRWPELGHIASVTSWVLLLAWASVQVEPSGQDAMLAWSFAWLLLGHGHAWVLLRRGRLSPRHAALRLWFHAYAAWFVGSMAARDDHAVAWVGLAMAAWNGATALGLVRFPARETRAGSLSTRAAVAACLSVAWLQLFAFAPLRLSDDGMLYWWAAMAILAAGLHMRRPRPATGLPFVLPFLASLSWSLTAASESVAWVAFCVAALPILASLWPGRAAIRAVSARRDLVLALVLSLGGMAWGLMAFGHNRGGDSWASWFVGLSFLAGLAITARALAAPSRGRCHATLALLTVLLAASIGASLSLDLFRPRVGFGRDRLWQVAVLAGTAGLAVSMGFAFRIRRQGEARWRARVFDLAGLLRTFALVILAMLLVSGAVASWTRSSIDAHSLNQAGWSVSFAVAGLNLLLRGLLVRRTLWRRVGILLLFVTAAKVLSVDLKEVSMAWRVLSFVGLGACMLLGAFAYRRLATSLDGS